MEPKGADTQFVVDNAVPTRLRGQVSASTTAAKAIMASINYRTMHRRLMHAGRGFDVLRNR